MLCSSLLDLLGTLSPVAERKVRFNYLDIAPTTILAPTSVPATVYSRNGSIASNTKPPFCIAMELLVIPAGHGRNPDLLVLLASGHWGITHSLGDLSPS